MKKLHITFGIIIGVTLVMGVYVLAAPPGLQTSVPTASDAGSILQSKSNGTWTPTTTSPALFGWILSTSTSQASRFPFASSTSISLSNLLNVNGLGTSTFTGNVSSNNLNVGGTLNVVGGCHGCGTGGGGSAAGIAGTVQFSDGASGFSGDATTFFWDNSVQRLGIGTGTPGTSLSVKGVGYIEATTTIQGGIITPNITATSSLNLYAGSTAVPQIRINSGGSGVGVGTSTPGARFSVTGEGLFDGRVLANLFVSTSTTDRNIFPIASTTSFSVGDRLWVAGAGTSTFIGGSTFGGLSTTNGLYVTNGAVRIPPINCDTLDTDGNGQILCGTDNASGGLTGGNTNAITYWTSNTSIAATSTLTTNSIFATSTTGTNEFQGIVRIATSTTDSTLTVGGSLLTKGTTTAMGGILTSSLSATGTLGFYSMGLPNPAAILRGATFGIGTTTPGAGLAVNGEGLFNGRVLSNLFVATSTTDRSIFPIASTTSFGIADRLTVSGTGTSTFTGFLSVGALSVATSTPSPLYGIDLSGRFLASGEGTSTIDANGTANGGLRIKGNLQVDGLDIRGGCKGCPVGGGGGSSSGIAGTVQFSDGATGFSGDASNLWWDNTSKLLGIATNTPTFSLSVGGGALFSATSSTSGFNLNDGCYAYKGGCESYHRYLKAVDTRTSNAVLATSSDLQFYMNPNETWTAHWVIPMSLHATPDIKWSIGIPSKATCVYSYNLFNGTSGVVTDDNGGVVCDTVTVDAVSTDVNSHLHIDVGVQNGVNAGYAGFQWAQNASGANAESVLVGATMDAYLVK